MQLKVIFPYLEKLLETFEKICAVESLYDTRRNDFNISKLLRNIENTQLFSDFISDLTINNIYSPYDLAWGILDILKATIEPLFTENLYRLWVIFNLNEEERIEKFKKCIIQLPEYHIIIMNKLFKIFVKISIENGAKTKLTPAFIGEIFATSLIRFKWRNPLDELGNLYHAPNIITTFIKNYQQIFSELDKDYERKQKLSEEKANIFMEYVLEKYSSFEEHFKQLYFEILKKDKNMDQKEIIQTIRIELNDNPFHKRKDRKKISMTLFEPPLQQLISN